MSESSSSDASLTVRLKLNDKDIRDKLKSLKTDIRAAFQDASYMVRGPAVAGQAPGQAQAPPKGEVLKFEGGPPSGMAVYGEHITVVGEGDRDPERRQNIFVNIQAPIKGELIRTQPPTRPGDVRESPETGDVALGVPPVENATTVRQWLDWTFAVMRTDYGAVKWMDRDLQRTVQSTVNDLNKFLREGVISEDTIIGNIGEQTYGEGFSINYLKGAMMNIRDALAIGTGTPERTAFTDIRKARSAQFRGPKTLASIEHESEKDIAGFLYEVTGKRPAKETDVGTGITDILARGQFDIIPSFTEVKTGVQRVGTPEHARQVASYMVSAKAGIEKYISDLLEYEEELPPGYINDVRNAYKAILMGRNIDITGTADEIMVASWRYIYSHLKTTFGDKLPDWVKPEYKSVFKTFDTARLLTLNERDTIMNQSIDGADYKEKITSHMWGKLVGNPRLFIEAVGADALQEQIAQGIVEYSISDAGLRKLIRENQGGTFNPYVPPATPEEGQQRATRFRALLHQARKGNLVTEKFFNDFFSKARVFQAGGTKAEMKGELTKRLLEAAETFPVGTFTGDDIHEMIRRFLRQDEYTFSEYVETFSDYIVELESISSEAGEDITADEPPAAPPQTRLQNIRKPGRANLGRGLRPTKAQIAGRRVRLDALGGLIAVSEGVTFYREIFESVRGKPADVNNFMAFLEENRTTNNEYSVILSYLGVPHQLKDPKRNLIATLRNELLDPRSDVSEQTEVERRQEIRAKRLRGKVPPDPELLKELEQFNIYQDFLKDVRGVEYTERSTRGIEKEAKIPRPFTKYMEMGEGIPKDIRTGKYSAFREGEGMYSQAQPQRMVRIRNFIMMGLIGGFLRPSEAHKIMRKGLGGRLFSGELAKLIRFGARIGKESGFTTMDMERSFDEIEAIWTANLKQNAPEVLEEIEKRVAEKEVTMGDMSEQTFGEFMENLDLDMGKLARTEGLSTRDEFTPIQRATMFYERGGGLPSVIMRMEREFERSVKRFETDDIADEHPLRPLGKTNKEVRDAMDYIKEMMNKDMADSDSEIYRRTFGNLQKLSELSLNIGLATNIAVWWPQNSGT